MLQLVRHQNVRPKQLITAAVGQTTPSALDKLLPQERQDIQDRYGRALLHLIRRCVEGEPSLRIPAEELLQVIHKIDRERDPADNTSLPMYARGLPPGAVLRFRPDPYLDLAR